MEAPQFFRLSSAPPCTVLWIVLMSFCGVSGATSTAKCLDISGAIIFGAFPRSPKIDTNSLGIQGTISDFPILQFEVLEGRNCLEQFFKFFVDQLHFLANHHFHWYLVLIFTLYGTLSICNMRLSKKKRRAHD
jgi:hypothetical protein